MKAYICWQYHISPVCFEVISIPPLLQHAGPSAWNALSDHLKDITLCLSTFRRQLKHFYFSFY